MQLAITDLLPVQSRNRACADVFPNAQTDSPSKGHIDLFSLHACPVHALRQHADSACAAMYDNV